VWNACINHEIKQCKTIIRFWNTTKQHHTKELAQRTQTAFCYSLNCTKPYYQLQFVIVHRVWHWKLTRHALNIKKTWDWLFDCLYILSNFVDIQMINHISKNYSRTHTPWVPLTYWILLGRLTTHVSFEVTVPSTLIVTKWAAERSFTSVY